MSWKKRRYIIIVLLITIVIRVVYNWVILTNMETQSVPSPKSSPSFLQAQWSCWVPWLSVHPSSCPPACPASCPSWLKCWPTPMWSCRRPASRPSDWSALSSATLKSWVSDSWVIRQSCHCRRGLFLSNLLKESAQLPLKNTLNGC